MDRDSDGCPAPGRPTSTALSVDVLRHRRNEVPAPDFALFREVLNRHFYPARVTALSARAAMTTPRLSALHLSSTTIGYVRFGTPASVDPGELTGYHVNVPLRGAVVSRWDDQQTTATPANAAVFSPGRPTCLPRWDADAVQLCIKLDRRAVERELADLLRTPVPQPVRFQLAFPLDSAAGRRWLSVLSALLQFADAVLDPADRQVTETLERSLIAGLLVSAQHSLSGQLHGDPARPVPRSALDAVVSAMENAPDRAYCLGDLSRLSGLSARSLQYAFHEQYGVSPMGYLRRVRLARAREDLRQANGTVAEIAAYWGFGNPGRFARAYREQFGEMPSQTLRTGPKGSRRPAAPG